MMSEIEYFSSFGFLERIQLQSNLPIIVRINQLVAQNPELEAHVDGVIRLLQQQEEDPTNLLTMLSYLPAERIASITSLIQHPSFTPEQFKAILESPLLLWQLSYGAESEYQVGDLTLAAELMEGVSQTRQDELLEEAEQYKGGADFFEQVIRDPTLITELSSSPTLTASLIELLNSPQLQQIIADVLASRLLASEEGVITGPLQAVIAQAVDTRLLDYGFQLPKIQAPESNNGFRNPSTWGTPGTLIDDSGQQVVPIELFQPIDEAVQTGSSEIQLSSENAVQRVTVLGQSQTENIEISGQSMLVEMRSLLSQIQSLADAILTPSQNTDSWAVNSMRRGYSSDQNV